MPIYALGDDPRFPDPHHAEPDGMLAVGGDLSPERLIVAYASGIFPWPIEGAPLVWFSPDPRMVLRFESLRVSRSLRKKLRSGDFLISMDRAFSRVVAACSSAERPGQRGTWITPEMTAAIQRMHALGFAHSVEVWHRADLVGGLYGLSIGGMFCGESMFHTMTDASKIAFVALARQLQSWDFDLLDCQLHTPHLESLGAEEISRAQFLDELDATAWRDTRRGRWTFELEPAELADNARWTTPAVR